MPKWHTLLPLAGASGATRWALVPATGKVIALAVLKSSLAAYDTLLESEVAHVS